VIISHEYRYVFVEMPHTASTAISKELCDNYKGLSILQKHTHYHEFLRGASEDERKYFVFAGMRNPLDIIVTRYFKLKTNHGGFFTNPDHWRKNGGHVNGRAVREYRFIQERSADFQAYFRGFHWYPFDSWGCPSPADFDFVIRYENLQADFSEFTKRIGIAQIGPLPLVNKTAERQDDFLSYYTPEIRKLAVWVFGPYLKLWGYQFPADWQVDNIPLWHEWAFRLLRFVRKNVVRASMLSEFSER
jgi:hypothetical protein